MYIDAVENNGVITTWVRTPTGELIMNTSPTPYYYYEETDEPTDIKSIFGEYVTKVEFDTRKDFNQARSSTLKRVHESDIAPLYKFLSDNFHTMKNKNLNIGYFDIEVDFDLSFGIGYPVPDNPYGEINSISLFDSNTLTYHMIVLLKDGVMVNLTDADFPVIVHECVTERQLLDKFVILIEDIDILSAWNGDFYDIPYIVLRCMKLYGNNEGLTKLCRDGHRAIQKYVKDDYDNEVLYYELVGRVHLDMMKVYKKSTFGERPSYRLDAICEYEDVGRKVNYKGDLGELYRTDPQKFFTYSLHDARLMYYLDRKMKILELSIVRAQNSTIRYTDVFGSIKPLEMKIRNYVHHERSEELALPDNIDSEKESFAGAFVVETKAGVYGYSSSVDLEALYPSVMRLLNISPDTHQFQCLGNDEDFVKIVERSSDLVSLRHIPSGTIVNTVAASVYMFLRENDLTISAYGSIFSKEQGILPEVLDMWVAERKAAKQKMFELQDEYNSKNIAGDTGLQQLKDDISYYDMIQQLAKLNNNSLYGAISNRYCRFYTIFCAASVTQSGQAIEKHQIYMSDKILQQKIESKGKQNV